MNTLSFLLGDSDESEPVERIQEMIDEMLALARAEHIDAIRKNTGLHEIGYRKGKVQSLCEVLEMIRTGQIPTAQ